MRNADGNAPVDSEEHDRDEDLKRPRVHEGLRRRFSVEVHDGEHLRDDEHKEAEDVEEVEPHRLVRLDVGRCQSRDDEDQLRGKDLKVRIGDCRTRQRHREFAQHDERFPSNDDTGTICGEAVEEKGKARSHPHGAVLGGFATRAHARWRAVSDLERKVHRDGKSNGERNAECVAGEEGSVRREDVRTRRESKATERSLRYAHDGTNDGKDHKGNVPFFVAYYGEVGDKVLHTVDRRGAVENRCDGGDERGVEREDQKHSDAGEALRGSKRAVPLLNVGGGHRLAHRSAAPDAPRQVAPHLEPRRDLTNAFLLHSLFAEVFRDEQQPRETEEKERKRHREEKGTVDLRLQRALNWRH